MALRHRLIGKAARFYWWFIRPRTLGVRALVRDDAGRIALVRHTYADHWYLPGGGVKKGESFAAAALREVEEEIGLTGCAVERILGVYHSRREYKDDHIVLFVLHAPAAAAIDVRDAREIAETGWFALDALPKDISAATARRIAEYRAGTIGAGLW
jgi:ADP-ribose pyrophosphatase YjhB (NUDIX family)